MAMLELLELSDRVTSDTRHLLLWAEWVHDAKTELPHGDLTPAKQQLAKRVHSLLRPGSSGHVLEYSAVAALPSPVLRPVALSVLGVPILLPGQAWPLGG